MLSAVFFLFVACSALLVATILVLSEYVSIDTVADEVLCEQELDVSDALEVVNDSPEPSDKQETLIIRHWDHVSVSASPVVERGPKKRAYHPPQARLAAALFAQEQQMVWYLTMLLLLEEDGEEEVEYNSVDVEDYDDLNDRVIDHVTKGPRGRRERGNNGLSRKERRLGIIAKRN